MRHRLLPAFSERRRRRVELAGAVKNVIAVAVGMAAGSGFGDNTKATIITRGLAGSRVWRAPRADPATMAGLAGLGSWSPPAPPASRATSPWTSHRRGHDSYRPSRPQGARRRARSLPVRRAPRALPDVEMPISDAVVGVIYEGLGVREMSRCSSPAPQGRAGLWGACVTLVSMNRSRTTPPAPARQRTRALARRRRFVPQRRTSVCAQPPPGAGGSLTATASTPPRGIPGAAWGRCPTTRRSSRAAARSAGHRGNVVLPADAGGGPSHGPRSRPATSAGVDVVLTLLHGPRETARSRVSSRWSTSPTWLRRLASAVGMESTS